MMVGAEGKLSALYYPYSRCVDANTLKMMAILYDEIVFVDPLEDTFREYLIMDRDAQQGVPDAVRERWRQNQEDWRQLQEYQILRFIDPIPDIQQNDNLLTAAFASDMADDDFVMTAQREGKPAAPWKMLASRLPAGVEESFRGKTSLGRKLLNARGQGATGWGTQYSDLAFGAEAWEKYSTLGYRDYVLHKLGGPHPTKSPLSRRRFDDVDESPLEPYDQVFLSGVETSRHPNNIEYARNAQDHTGQRIRVLAFSQGVSLSISQAILLADQYGFTPVTDSALHQQLMAIKYRRALSNVDLLDQPVIGGRRADDLERLSVVGRAVLMEALSPAFLTQLSIGDALRYRDANLEALTRFRTKITSLAHDLGDGTGPGYGRSLRKLIDQAVVPELQALSDKLEESRRKVFGNLMTKAVTTAVPATAVVSLYAAFSGPALLALGVGAGATAFELSVASIVERWQERRKLNQDWLSFAVDLKRTGSRPRR
jgi:hypothetical protein